MNPRHPEDRPTPAEHAELLLASLELSTDVEVDIIRDSFRRRAAHALAHDGPIEISEKARARREYRFREHVDEHLQALRGFAENGPFDIAARFISDISFRLGDSETPDVLGIIEVRDRNGRSVVPTETRLFPIERGVAMVEGRSFHQGNGFEVKPLLSPRAYAAELEKLRSLAAAVSDDGRALEQLEQTSLLYHLIRTALVERHGISASWYRDVGFIAPIGFPDRPGVSVILSPNSQFIARPVYEESSCRISIETRAVTKH
ncbi:MAG: hypothetical protein RL417_1162 [Pseudomonadota bacterium]|jgi:hypothetical protein